MNSKIEKTNRYKMQIAPSILSADFSKMGAEIERMEAAGADLVHCDVMDGMFVPNITFGPKMIKDIRKLTKLKLDTHLMVKNPERYVEDFIAAGSDIVTIHVEATDKVSETLATIRAKGASAGVVINPETEVERCYEFLHLCDMVLVMSVHPGFGGQKFIPSALEKLEKLAKFRAEHNLNFDIEIDGGINEENIEAVKESGANIIVAGNTVFSHPDTAFIIKKLRGE